MSDDDDEVARELLGQVWDGSEEVQGPWTLEGLADRLRGANLPPEYATPDRYEFPHPKVGQLKTQLCSSCGMPVTNRAAHTTWHGALASLAEMVRTFGVRMNEGGL